MIAYWLCPHMVGRGVVGEKRKERRERRRKRREKGAGRQKGEPGHAHSSTSSYWDTDVIGSGPTHMTSFNLGYVHKHTISNTATLEMRSST